MNGRTKTCRMIAASMLGIALAGPAPGNDEPIRIEARPSSVTIYAGSAIAMVTRRADVALGAGSGTVVFADLPDGIRPESIQVRAGAEAKVLDLRLVERPAGDPPARVRAIDERLGQIVAEIAAAEQDRALLDARRTFIDRFAAWAAGGNADAPPPDLGQVRANLEFVSSEREELLESDRAIDARVRALKAEQLALTEERGELTGDLRDTLDAEVTLGLPAAAEVPVDLVYLAEDAYWEPGYDIRAAVDGSGVTIDYHATVSQATGEDWEDVTLVLSTAQPSLAAAPPRLDPWFVDVVEPRPRRSPPGSASARVAAPAEKVLAGGGGAIFGDPGDDAAVGGGGPSVTYTIPRAVTVRRSELMPEDVQRLRIATIDAPATYVHVAIPLHTEAVYVRGELVNASAYQLLPGEAKIFVGPDYVGDVALEDIAPQATFPLYFGVDRTVTTERLLVEKKDSKTGLLGGGLRTSFAYRILVENDAGKAITLELWDRIPVSRSDKVEIETVDLTPPLATDAIYVEEDLPRGLLKWSLTVPPTGPNAPFEIEYGLRVTRAKDVVTTPLPE